MQDEILLLVLHHYRIILLSCQLVCPEALSVVEDELAFSQVDILSNLKELLEVGGRLQLSDHSHDGTRQTGAIERPEHAAHKYIVPFENAHYFLMDIAAVLEGVDLRSSWDQYLDPHISFRHDIVDAEHALRDSLDDLGLILLARVLPLSREAREAARRLLSLNTSAAIRMLIYAIGDVGSHAGARARVNAVHVVIETEHLRLRRLLL